MRPLLWFVTIAWNLHLCVGGILGLILQFSYDYALLILVWELGWDLFTWGGLGAAVILSINAVVDPLWRFLFWLPSLIIWFLYGTDSFSHWLAPPFFVSVGQ